LLVRAVEVGSKGARRRAVYERSTKECKGGVVNWTTAAPIETSQETLTVHTINEV